MGPMSPQKEQNVIDIIRSCVSRKSIFWTYHVSMRMAERFVPRQIIFASLDTYEIIESYPDDKYLPSYLIRAEHEEVVFHILFALDRDNDAVRIITTYTPSSEKWEADGRTRRKS
ncbi:hypothetical protein Gmet_3092 [Geobacter metallireducens GS-15]|uniref:DUF4258 domain-containing protein n=2 Tax=Geobacter metallireducens TaxID=28232 RepID=Q39R18_GEOMG|nr:hypothetical protein Gmet_3092 [Geobacter metallireducens GS-15]